MRTLIAVATATAALGAAGLALAASTSQQALIDTTVAFLQESQRGSGGFAPPGATPSQGISAWVAIALASAGINPQDQARCGTDAFTYLVDHFHEGLEKEIAWPQIATTSFERELLVVDATGTDPHEFAGYDLVAELLRRQLPDGSFAYVPQGEKGESNDTIFAILALAPVHEVDVEAAVARAAEWLVGAEDEDGGWYFSGKATASEVDMTGAALEALVAAGAPPPGPALLAYEEAIEGGIAYLHAAQLPDGGFPALPAGERESNVASTAWAVQAIWATGGNPEDWTVGPGVREPLDYMASMQQPDGHIRWRASSDLNGIWMTAYVTPAFAGQALPVPTAARNDPRATRGEAAACLEAGEGGGGEGSAEGVTSGGGGGGAPLFTRPKPQSEGKTPGGARTVHGRRRRSRDHSDSRRGENASQPHGTEAREPRTAAEADQEVTSASGDTATATAGSGASAGGNDGQGSAPGTRAAPLPAAEARRRARTAEGKEVSGVLIDAPDGHGDKLAFGAPGLRAAGAGRGEGAWVAAVIAAAIVVSALGGIGWERRREGTR